MATSDISLNQVAAAIKDIYRADSTTAAGNVEERLSHTLADCTPSERNDLLEKLIADFSDNRGNAPAVSKIHSDQYNKLLTMLLGKEILKKELSTEEMVEQLAAAVNTVFDSVNTLVGGINATLMGSVNSEETIRVVIRSSMDKEEGIGALQKFLDQIGDFFSIALEAYKESARVKIGEILQELNPEQIEKESNVSMKFGPLYKANLYDCYQDKYKTLQNWQNSGLLLEAFLKEFEKNCQNLCSSKAMK